MKTPIFSRAGLLAVLVAIATAALQGLGVALTVINNKDNAPSTALIAGSLRWAIANTPASGLVDFAPALKGNTIVLKAGQLVVDKSLTIRGLGCGNLTVSGNTVSRVFFVGGTATNPGLPNVILSDMTITRGNAVGPVFPANVNASNGGGIHNAGTLQLLRVCVTGNTASLGSGGGIYNRGTLSSVTECTVSYNNAGQNGGGIFDEQDMTIIRSAICNNIAGGNGGGIQEAGTANYINSTISNNRATGSGGGVNDPGYATLNTYNVTIADNTAGDGGGLATQAPGNSWALANTIVANNSATTNADIANPFGFPVSVANGHNLVRNTNGGTLGGLDPSDITGVDPKLGPLQNNGGPTLTMALLPGSPAIDKGANGNVLASMTTDQRTFMVRIINGGISLTVDIGAYEYTTARGLKNEAIADLTPCLSSTNCKTRLRAAAAILRIQRSLTPALWVNDTTLTRCGELVFEKEEEAAYIIQKIIMESPDMACVQQAIYAAEDLVLADEQLARAAIAAALAANGNASKIQDAKNELVTAQSYLAKQDYKGTIEHYEHAWVRAEEAQGIKEDEDCCRALKKQWEHDGDDDDDHDDDCN